jgi:pimeloyl-ACP methyl ester carboxylesterase
MVSLESPLAALVFVPTTQFHAAVTGCCVSPHPDGPRQYYVWAALFAVLANNRAVRVLRVILPDLPANGETRIIANRFTRRVGRAGTNAAAEQALAEALSGLQASVGSINVNRLYEVGRLLEPDTSGDAAAASAWTQILRMSGRPPFAQPQLQELAGQMAHVIEFEPGTFVGLFGFRRWEGLIEFAQGRLVAEHVSTYLRACDPAERANLLTAAEATARRLHIPTDGLRKVVDSAVSGGSNVARSVS